MSKITLKPLDDGQKAVEIPVGRTTIGRGPFLGCSDKKVSRNHAVLEVTNKGDVYLTPTHVNPCFYQPTAYSPGQILKKDIPHKLENGDSFSLLPRAFRYQLIVAGDGCEDKEIDQNDLNKQCGKTNGAAGESPETMLNEGNKDAVKIISSEELNETTVTEKPCSKEEELQTNMDKNCLKEDNTFSKKITDVTEDSESNCFRESKVINDERECTEKETSQSKNDCVAEGSSACVENTPKEDIKDDSSVDDILNESKEGPLVNATELASKVGDLNIIDGKTAVEDKGKSFGDKVTEENESTLGNDSFPKDSKLETDEVLSEPDKSQANISPESCDKSQVENNKESNGEDEAGAAPTKESVEETEESLQAVPEWTDEQSSPTKGPRRKKQAPRQPRPERIPAKRKAVSDNQPKQRGRKKAEKVEFNDGEEGNSQRQVAGRTSSRTNRQTRQGLSLEDFIVSDDDEWQSDRSEPKQRRKRGSRKGDDSGSDWEIEHKKSKKVAHKFGSGSESGSDWGTHKKKRGPKGRRRKNKRTMSEAGSEEDAGLSSEVKAKRDKPRIPCTYGKKCFRRNQGHLDQFCHPGDSDYASEPEEALPPPPPPPQKNNAVSESEEDETNKKECPYGANCFRKNPQHKKDFKHTKKVRPQREAAKQADKKTKGSRNSDEIDSYDLNDSFLNDDSDEYKPVDSGSDYESGEKLKRFSKGKAAKNKRGKKV